MAGNGWEVDWSQESAVVKTAPVKMHKHLNTTGAPEAFADPDAVLNGLPSGPPIRNPLPGEAGSRNAFRGDGYFGVDSGLSKAWKIYREQTLKFTWEVFNVTNSVRFDVNPLNSLQNQTSSGEFGVYGAVLTLSLIHISQLLFHRYLSLGSWGRPVCAANPRPVSTGQWF